MLYCINNEKKKPETERYRRYRGIKSVTNISIKAVILFKYIIIKVSV